jgi:hypothetical protein
MSRQSTGSPVMALKSARAAGACSAGASVPSRMCKARSIRPRPIAMRPRARVRLWPPARKVTTPTMNRAGAIAEMSKEKSCTMRVVPTLAPSMMASAGTRLTSPSAASDVVISPVAVLLCSSAVRSMPAPNALKRLFSALPRKRRRSWPNARNTPLRTICSPHSSSATPPIRSRRTIDAIATGSPFSLQHRAKEPSAHVGPSRDLHNPKYGRMLNVSGLQRNKYLSAANTWAFATRICRSRRAGRAYGSSSVSQ